MGASAQICGATDFGGARSQRRGWRSAFYWRLALALPEELELVGVMARTDEAARSVEETGLTSPRPTVGAQVPVKPSSVVDGAAKRTL